MLLGESLTRLLQGVGAGAIATLVMGFSLGPVGYRRGGKTHGLRGRIEWTDVCAGPPTRRPVLGY